MTDDVLDSIFELQYIGLCQEVATELEARGVTDVKAAEILIDICKEVDSPEEFLERVNQLKLPIKEQFIANLYIVIKKKLPKKNNDTVAEVLPPAQEQE